MAGCIWEVIGGAGKGGILARAAADIASDLLAPRLAVGAVVRARAVEGQRLQYELLAGTGPPTGWVSMSTQDKSLLSCVVNIWKVVGGVDRGGIIVRSGQDVESEALSDRLSTGSIVQGLELVGARLRYRLLTGHGPDRGWVSVLLPDRELLVRVDQTPHDQYHEGGGNGSTDAAGAKPQHHHNVTHRNTPRDDFDPYAILGIKPDATDAMIRSAFRKASLKVHPDHCHDDDQEQAAERFRMLTDVKNFLLDPRKRRMYNLSHGLLQQTVNTKWWSTWEEIFEEIVPASVEDAIEPLIPAPTEARIDILVFGATGIVGMLACMLLQRQASARTWAIAGRDEGKLKCLVEKFGGGPCFRGANPVRSPEDLDQLARIARVTIDLTGPKFHIGGVLAEACVRAGTHYIDVTGCAGDVPLVADLRNTLDSAAKAAGVALIFFCGWSSTQVDLGVWLMVKHLRESFGTPTRCVNVYRWFQGGGWGGTHMLTYKGPENLDADLKARGPFPLGGERGGQVRKEDEDERMTAKDAISGMWVAMDSPPDNVVPRCSCGLFDDTPEAYGDAFLFKNWGLWTDKHSGDMTLMSNKFLRTGYARAVSEGKIPPPGTGAKERIRQESYVTMVFVGEADEKVQQEAQLPRRAHCTLVTGPGGMGDPYECSATVAVEAALCALDALDSGRLLRSGFGTPAYHLAHLGFTDRLVARGNSYRMEDGTPPQELFRNIVASAAPLAA